MDLEALVAQMRSLGVRKFKNGEVEIELDDPPVSKPSFDDDESDSRSLEQVLELAKERRNRTLFGASSMRPVSK